MPLDASIDPSTPLSFKRFKGFVESRNDGNTVSIYKLIVRSKVIASLLEETIYDLLNDKKMKELINDLEKPNAKFWCSKFPGEVSIGNLDIKVLSIFDLMATLCKLSSDRVLEDNPPDLVERFEISMNLFNEIVQMRFEDFTVRRFCSGWLNFQTYPLCSTEVIFDSNKNVLWLLFWNNWNF